MIGPIELNAFTATDFATLEKYELRKRTGPVIEALKNLTITSETVDRCPHFVYLYQFPMLIPIASIDMHGLTAPRPPCTLLGRIVGLAIADKSSCLTAASIPRGFGMKGSPGSNSYSLPESPPVNCNARA